MKNRKRFLRILAAPDNVRFGDMVALIESFGFRLRRTSGGHHIFGHEQIREQLNLQNVGGKAKPYQIRQFIKLVERYNLTMEQR